MERMGTEVKFLKNMHGMSTCHQNFHFFSIDHVQYDFHIIVKFRYSALPLVNVLSPPIRTCTPYLWPKMDASRGERFDDIFGIHELL